MSYYAVDGLGSVALVSDASGVTQNSYTYDAWGVARSATEAVPQPFRYTSREVGELTNQLFYRARFYTPSTGRFLSEDPLSYAAGMNLFLYVHARPAENVDPMGLRACKDNSQDMGRFRDSYDKWFNNKPSLGLGQKGTAAMLWGPLGNACFLATGGRAGSSCVGWAVGLLKVLQPLTTDCCRAVEDVNSTMTHTKIRIECRCSTDSDDWKAVSTFDPYWRIPLPPGSFRRLP